MTKWTIFGTITCIIGIINVCLFALWISIIKIDSSLPPENRQFWIDGLNAQLAVLDTIIVSVSLLLAIAGIVGYNALKCAAEDRAEKTANHVANQKMADFLRQQQQLAGNQSTYSPQPAGISTQSAATQTGAQPITGGII